MTLTFPTAAKRRSHHYHLDPEKYRDKYGGLFGRGRDKRVVRDAFMNLKPTTEDDEIIAFYTTKKKRDEAAWKEINKVVIKKAE